MASNFTEHFQLNQWEPGDQVLREDFNADNAKIDAALAALDAAKGNCQIITGTYIGTGEYGEQHPTTITFPKRPLIAFVVKYIPMILVYPSERGVMPGGGYSGQSYMVNWSGNTVSWYQISSPYSAANQLNEAGTTYHYIALVEA